LNILTKICVVILLVLVLFASFTFINMATVPQNWKLQYQQERQKATLNAQAVRFEKLHSSRLGQELEDVKNRLNTVATELAAAKKAKEPNAADILVASLKGEVQTLTTRLTELQNNVEAMSKRNALLVAQLDGGRKVMDDLQKQNRRGTAEITQLRGKLERSERVVRALQRQLQDREERIQELEGQVLAGGGKTTPDSRPTAATLISGTLTAVQGELASVNVGSAQGVSRGLKLYIYRGANFVGYLRVDEVDDGESAGTILDKQLDPIVGDKVTSDLLK